MKIGVLGGGQLGRMLAFAGLPLELRFRTLDPHPNSPMSAVAEQIVGEYEDYAALADFVAGVDAVTYEFENVPVGAVRWLADRVPVFPPAEALAIAQDRLEEKEFFRRIDARVGPFRAVETRHDYDSALAGVGWPCVLKTRRFGYDGKGQVRITKVDDAEVAWRKLGGRPLILEQWLPFDREVSLLAARGHDGRVAIYPLIENTHRDGILRMSVAPVVDANLARQAGAIARRALESLNYVGVLAIEFFDVGGELFVNEMAPRVHNSGHWTIEGAATSQFANHLRAGLGLPLGDASVLTSAAMLNLIGTIPDPAEVLAVPGASLHLYGKVPRPNRKVGHITVLADDAETLRLRLGVLARIIER